MLALMTQGHGFARLCPLVLIIILLGPSIASAQNWIVSGTVQDSMGVGIPGVDIDMTWNGTALNLTGDVTDATGAFSATILDLIPAATIEFAFNPATGSNFFPATASHPIVSSTTIPTMVLDSGWFVSGRVINAGGVGLEEVDLNFFDSGGALFAASGDVTDSAGDFSVLVPEDTYDIELRSTPMTPGGPYVPLLLEGLPIVADTDLGDRTFLLGYSLTGIVQTAGGTPVVGADIDVIDPVTGDNLHTPGDFTDSVGSFQTLVPVGNWHVEINPPSGTVLVPALLPYTVAPPPAINDLGTTVLQPGVIVSGTTVESGGAIVPDVDLDFFDSATQIEIVTVHDNANSNGNFSVVVEPGTYDIAYRPQVSSGLAPLVQANIVVTGNVALGSVVLPAGHLISGTVTASGLPVEGARVTLVDSVGGQPVYTFGNQTDLLGGYSLRQLSGTYDLTFTPPLGSMLQPGSMRGVVVTSDTTVDVDLAAATPPPAVTGLACTDVGADAQLSWTNAAPDYDTIDIVRDGALIVSLAGNAVQFTDAGLADATYAYDVVPQRSALAAAAQSCSVTIQVVVPPPPSVSMLTCVDAGADAQLTWTNAAPDYDSIDIIRDGVTVATLPGGDTQYVDAALTNATYAFDVVAVRGGVNAAPQSCSVTIQVGVTGIFERGNTNGDMTINLADAVQILGYLFSSAPMVCLDAGDINDDGSVNIADAVALLNYLFSGGAAPPPPFGMPGVDPTPDGLICP